MKNNKKNFNTFNKRNTHKRRSKDKARRELMRAVEETNVRADSLKIRDVSDIGAPDSVYFGERIGDKRATGEFSSARGGFGFVSIPDYERDIFIPEDKTLGAMDGDTVEITYRIIRAGYKSEEKTVGAVKKIINQARSSIIGTVRSYSARRFVAYSRGKSTKQGAELIPDDPRLPTLPIESLAGASEGDKVEAKIIRSAYGRHSCTVTRIFGQTESKEANYAAILAECEIPVDFSKEELAEARFFAAMPLSEEGRVRRGEVILTIDGEGAKDLDDAVSLRKIRGGWQLGVHIADVSAYVRERTHLDRAVMARGTSVYFTDKVVPMLPKELSNGACSLNAGEDKYTLSAIINLDESGEIKGVKIEPSIICSRVRGVYSEVNKIFENTADAPTRAKYKAVLPTLSRMRELYLILLERSRKRGSVELDGPEAEIILNDAGEPVDIVRRSRGDAERLIEQFMLIANEAVARYLSDKGLPCVYRIHENPPPDKLEEFISYAHNLGFDTGFISAERCGAGDFSALLKEAEQRGMLPQISYALLRSMAKAKYSEIRKGHFGLALDYYCHFTSPIRRLSDLATHRIIHKTLLEGKRPELYEKYARRAAAAATEAELRAVAAERRIENLYKVIYMQDKLGMEFDAVINSITSFGFFAELENTCEGLVPISELAGEFFFDEKNITLRSRRKIYRIADKVRVRLEEADIIRGKLRFSVVED